MRGGGGGRPQTAPAQPIDYTGLLNVSKDIGLPWDIVTQTVGILGQKGSGKTHFATVMLEEMIENSLPVVVIDPMGVFYGVRSSIDGKRPGLDVTILGGEFGDVSIAPGMGRGVAQWLVQDRRPVILDLSDMRNEPQCEFVADFAEELYVLNRGRTHGIPLHIIVDEADLYAPQQPGSTAEKRSLGALDDIVRRGRRRGLGLTMITQRPAAIAKAILTQISVLAIFRIVGPQDRRAMEDWLKYGAGMQRDLVLNSLGTLPPGCAWIWSPGWLKVLKKVQMRQRRTFDSGITPKVGEKPHGDLVMADIDISGIAESLNDLCVEVAENDPKVIPVLRNRVAFLEELLEEHGIKIPDQPTKKKRRKK